jgi:hypothetical protein
VEREYCRSGLVVEPFLTLKVAEGCGRVCGITAGPAGLRQMAMVFVPLMIVGS